MADEQAERLKETWRLWLEGFRFDTFGTVTFAEGCPSARAALWRAKKNLRDFCKRIGVDRPCAFLVAEPHSTGKSWHCHLLWRSPCNGDAEKLRCLLRCCWQFFFERCGRSSFEVVRDAEAVRAYVSKYLLKQGDACEWSIIGEGVRK